MKNLVFIFSLVLLSMGIYAFSEKGKTKRLEYLGQAAPPDMEFIPGNEHIPSFFIGKSQETNMNYAIYLDWLKDVYHRFPQIASNALPHDLDKGELFKFNDPFIKEQLTNSAFAYYPIVGVDWKQVQEYLAWKTDRLNEAILVRLEYLLPMYDQQEEDNYNYDAFLAAQYLGMQNAKKPFIRFYDPRNYWTSDYNFAMVYPFLHAGYRLPTEAEWEYAAKDEFANRQTASNGHYPFGGKFFLWDHIEKFPFHEENPMLTYLQKAGSVPNAELGQLKAANVYDTRSYGVYNMGNNVKEWLMDFYTPEKQHYNSVEEIFRKNGFILAEKKMYDDQDGFIAEKDSFGKLPFRTMGISNNGNDFRVMQYPFYEYRLVIDTTYYTHFPGSFFVTKKFVRIPAAENAMRYRVVKSGTWKNPSVTARESMKETDASADVGFRVVIPYLGMPIDKKNRVKWK